MRCHVFPSFGMAQKKRKKQSEAAPAAAASDPFLWVRATLPPAGNWMVREATAKLIDKIPGTVFAVGDLAYPDGSDEQFANCYGPTWGRFKDRTRPAVGNHEYHSDGASGYARYFAGAAGDPKKGILQLRAWGRGTLL